jgi:hypothetical protein
MKIEENDSSGVQSCETLDRALCSKAELSRPWSLLIWIDVSDLASALSRPSLGRILWAGASPSATLAIGSERKFRGTDEHGAASGHGHQRRFWGRISPSNDAESFLRSRQKSG